MIRNIDAGVVVYVSITMSRKFSLKAKVSPGDSPASTSAHRHRIHLVWPFMRGAPQPTTTTLQVAWYLNQAKRAPEQYQQISILMKVEIEILQMNG